MKINFEVTAEIAATPEQIYEAWLDSVKHSAMTGGMAEVSDQPGQSFTAWDGYITGKNLELEPGKRILQAWRTSEFDEADPDSLLEILMMGSQKGCSLILRHSNLPDHGMQYKQGWVDNYFEPMADYFGAE